MKSNEIQKLIDRYFQGESSLEEEKILKKYFSAGNVAPEFDSLSPLFNSFSSLKEKEASPDFESKLIASIEQEARTKIRPMWSSMLRIAASLVLLFAIWFLMPKSIGNLEDPIATRNGIELSEEEALEETLAALQLLSSKLNGGKKKVSSGMSNVDKVVRPMPN